MATVVEGQVTHHRVTPGETVERFGVEDIDDLVSGSVGQEERRRVRSDVGPVAKAVRKKPSDAYNCDDIGPNRSSIGSSKRTCQRHRATLGEAGDNHRSVTEVRLQPRQRFRRTGVLLVPLLPPRPEAGVADDRPCAEADGHPRERFPERLGDAEQCSGDGIEAVQQQQFHASKRATELFAEACSGENRRGTVAVR